MHNHYMIRSAATLFEALTRATRKHAFLLMLFPGYLLLDWVSFPPPYHNTGISAWNPLSGLCLFILIRWGGAAFPLLFVARACCDLLHHHVVAMPIGVLWANSVLMVVYLLTSQALGRFLRFDARTPSARRILIFIGAATVSALLIALSYVAAIGSVSALSWTEFAALWQRRYVGDIIGILTVLPGLTVIEGWYGRNDLPSGLSKVTVVQAVLVAGIAAVLFAWPEINDSKTFYLLFVPMIWVALTDGLGGVALLLFITGLALFGTIGLLGLASPSDVSPTHLMVITQALTGLLLGAAVAESQHKGQESRPAAESPAPEFDAVSDAMVTVHDDGRVRSYNPAAAWLFGLERESGAGLRLDSLLPDLDTLRVRPRSVVETHAQRRDGRMVPVELALDWTQQEGGPIMALMARDISARKTLEAELANKQTELSLVSRRSITGELAAVMAHEINQPLTAIVNYIGVCQQLAADGDNRELLSETLGKVARQANRSGEIIRHLRRFLSQGDGMPSANKLDRVLDEALMLIASYIAKSGVEIRVSVPEELPPVLVDNVQIQQVLHNLIRNAVEAMAEAGTPSPSLEIEAHLAESDSGEITVSVSDTGPGLSAEARRTLFTPFRTAKSNGMGPGLSISRSIVESHCGRLWLEASQGGGAQFRFTLPIAPREKET